MILSSTNCLLNVIFDNEKSVEILAKAGFDAYVLFVIQMSDVQYLHPNDITDPAFSEALREASQEGVTVLAMDCEITPDTMRLRQPIQICL